jgi:hypothetical protein
MNCEEILTLLDAYFDNELDLAKTIAIEEHLRTCASCRSQYELRVALRRSQRCRRPNSQEFGTLISPKQKDPFVSGCRLDSGCDCSGCGIRSVRIREHWAINS